MKIVCLIDDEYASDLISEHGMSLYCETKGHKLLFDVGQSSAFIKNAKDLGVDLLQVDTLVISHGHYDHGGGLEAFLDLNHHAKVYIQSSAFQSFYSLRKSDNLVYIGLDKLLKKHPQVQLIDGDYDLGDGMFLVNKMHSNLWFPKGNKTLFNGQRLDRFRHEQSLVISENGVNVLLAGCAHRGILNIAKAASRYVNNQILDTVIGGFHLSSRHPDFLMEEDEIINLAQALVPLSKSYVTGHCTDERAYQILAKVMHGKLDKFYPGWFNEF